MGRREGVVMKVAFSIMLLCLITLSAMAYGSINSGQVASSGNYANFSILTSYWLKLPKINADSNMTIYMGFASNTTNLFNGVTVGEAPQLSSKYGEYDNGKNVFLYYTNFTNLNGWVVNVSKGSYSVNDGLSVNFNGPGYVVTDSTYGPGTAFMAGINSIGDVDNVGYFNLNETLNNGGGWAGAFIRLACGNTYPDQWNASGEANGCGSPYGYFVNKEGIPGTYLVEILNRTSSIQFLNGNFSRSINIDYPLYPAHVGFDGAFTSISVQWAAVMNLPPNGVMPSFNVSNQVYPAGSNPNVAVPSGIIYYIPIQIANDQPVPTPNEYQQLVLVNSSAYQKYEAPNLDNVEFFYANGTVIPSWLESNNERTSGSISQQTYSVTFTETGLPPGTQWSVTFNGVTKTSTTSNITFTGVPAGNYTWNATSIIAMGNGTRYVAPTSSGTISVPATTSFNVSYVKQYIVTIESTAGGSTIPSGTSWYNAGSNVSITAIPASGYEFVGWETNSSIAFTNSSSAATNAIINSAGTIVATFKAIPSSPQPSSYTLEYIVAAVFIVIVILAAVLLIRRRK